MAQGRLTQMVAVLVALGCLAVSGLVGAQIAASSGRHKLTFTERAVEGDPPQVAVGIAMGAFRGLFVNMLWIRANELKEEGKYYEAVDLARAITRLQPRFPRVWAFHAWNMAYNISVTTNTPEERWDWVSQGIDLLREEGVVHNPNDMLIHKELAWIFLHKIQAFADDAHWHYKLQLAAEWHELLGPPPMPEPGNNTRQRRIEQFEQWLRPIVDAPESLSEVVEREPRVQRILDRLAQLDVDPTGQRLLKNVTRTRIAMRSATWESLREQADDTFLAVADLVADPELESAWEAYLAHLRRRVLVDEFNMEPSRMLRYTSRYGPLDWRHPASHALYWARKGVDAALTRVEDRNRGDFDFVNTDRLVVHAVQELWRTGQLWFDYNGMLLNPHRGQPFYLGIPNTAYIPVYQQILEEVVARSKFDGLDRAYSSYFAGYENFMQDAIRYLYRRGQRELAAQMKRDLAEFPYANTNDPRRAQFLAQDIDRFVQTELMDRVGSPSVAIQEVVGALQDAYLSGLVGGDDEVFDAQMQYARRFHAAYLEQQLRANNVAEGQGRAEYLDRRFDFLAGNIFNNLLPQLDIDFAKTAYNNAPAELQRWAYDGLVERYKRAFDDQAERGGTPFAVAFPEPPGMQEHRDMVRQELESRRRGVERERK